MATDKRFVVKNGLQTENINFVFNDAVLGSSNITATMLSSNTLSFSGTTGQLFAITDSMTGVIFAVNDISGVPSIEVYDDGRITLAETFGNVTIGNSTISSSRTSTSTTTGILQVAGGVGVTGNINVGGPVNTFSGNIGIGTTGPGQKLTVNVNSGEYIRIQPSSAFDGFTGLQFTTVGGSAERAFFKWNPAVGEVRIGGGPAGYFPTFYAEGAEAMRINTSGNVGIGTSTIQTGYKLQVQGDSSFTNRVGIGTSSIVGISNALVVYGSAMVYGNVDLANPAGGTSGIYFNDGSYQTTAFTGAATPSFGTPGTVQIAGAGNTFSGNSDNFFWDAATSRLGIGINTPTNVLTVRSTATPAWFNTVNSAVGSNNFEILVGNGTSTGTTVGYVNNTLVPYGYLSTGTSTRNIVVAANGRVGIGGVTAPQVLLDVGGSAVIGASWAGNSNFINPPASGLAVQGSVGIGTYTPLAALDVRGGVGVTAASNFNSGLSVASLTSNGAVSGTTGTFSGDLSIADKIVHTGDTDTAIRFPAADTFTVETSGSERLRINANGNVGIGTTSPSSTLHLTSTTPQLTLRSSNGNTNKISLQNVTLTELLSIETESTANSLISAFGYLTLKASSASAQIRLQTGGSNDRITITETGLVGIATITPGSTLDVNGIASFRSAVSVAGLATVGSLTVNTGIFTNSLNVNTTANVGALTSNTGITVSAGGISVTGISNFTGNINVTGNVNVSGALNVVNSNVLTVNDPIIYLGEGNPGNTFDIGLVGNYNQGTYYHTGIVRDHRNNYWTLFDTLVSEPNVNTGNINWADSSITFADFRVGNINIMGNAQSTSSTSGVIVVNGVGGIGVGGNINVGGQRSVFSGNMLIQGSNTATSATTGALIVQGGVGVGGNLHIADRILLQASGSDGRLTTTNGGWLRLDASGGRIFSAQPFFVNSINSSFGDIAFSTNIDSSGSERMRITSTGLVGIGTTAPSYTLDVTNSTVRFGQSYIQGAAGRIGIFLTNPSDNAFQIQRGSDSANLLFVNASGLVGIGTTNPLSALDVRGGIGVTAASNFGGGLSVASLTSNGAISGTTGAFSTSLYSAAFNTAGTATVAALVSNGAITGTTITGTNYLVTTASSTQASGAAIQRVFNKTVAATELYKLAEYSQSEGIIAIEIQVASLTSANSGTTTYRFQGGYGSLAGAYYRLMPFNDGRGHGEGPDTGSSTLAWEVYIYGATVSGSPVTYGVAVSVPTGAVTKTLITTITELRRGMTFTDKSADSVFTIFTNSGSIYSHRNLLIESRVGIATTAPGSTLDVNGIASFRSSISVASTATVGSLTSNGAVSGTTGTFTSIQNSGLLRAANIVSNTWIHATQNLTVASSNTSVSTATGALVVTGGAGIGGNIYASGNIVAASFQPTSASVPGAGLYLPTTNTLAFSTAGLERFRVGSGGNVSIGTTTNDAILRIGRAAQGGSDTRSFLKIQSNDNMDNLTVDPTMLEIVSTAGGVPRGNLISATSSTSVGTGRFVVTSNPSAATVRAFTEISYVGTTVNNGYSSPVSGFNPTTILGISGNTSAWFDGLSPAIGVGVNLDITWGGGTPIYRSVYGVPVKIRGENPSADSYAFYADVTEAANNWAFYAAAGNVGIVQSLGIGSTLSVAGSTLVNTLTANSTIQTSSTVTTNALISNVYGRFGQNVTVNSANASTTTATGALVVTGGVGVGGNINVGGVHNTMTGKLTVGTSTLGDAQLTVNTASPVYSDLRTGNFGWWRMSSVSTNNAGTFRIDSQNSSYVPFSANGDTQTLNLGGNVGINVAAPVAKLQVLGNVWANNSDVSISTTTGAIRTEGGVGIGGNINVGGTHNLFTNRVGVGTTNAATVSNTFVVFGTTNITGNIVLTNPAGGTSGVYYADGTYQTTAYTGVFERTVLNDVSRQADGEQSVFALKLDQTAISPSLIVDSKDLEVTVNGYQLTPHVTELAYPWFNDCFSFNGFRVRENRLIIYNSPEVGSKINIVMNKSSLTKQKRRYPFSATTIGLGD